MLLQEREHEMKATSLEESLRHKVMAIDNLENETKRLQQGISELTKEIDAKNKQITKIRNEAFQNLRLAFIIY